MGTLICVWPARIILFLGFLLLYIRLYWGIDFTDESYMVLNAVGPVLGAKPFVVDQMISQTGSLLMTPFAFVFHMFSPQLAGVILFFRHLYYAVAVLTSLILFRALRGKLTDHDRAFTSLLPLVIIPACQPVPSYNSLMMFFALAGQMYFLSGSSARAGVFHALAAFSHPAFLSGVSITSVVALWSRKKRDFHLYIRGAALLILLVALLIVWVGWANLTAAFDLSARSSTFGGQEKLNMMWGEFLGYWRRPLLVVCWAAACALTGLAGRLNWAVALGGFAVTQDFWIPDEIPYGLQQRFVCYGWFILFLVLVDLKGWRESENRTWLARLFVPSLLAGLAISWTSSNGLVMAPIGWMGIYVYAFWRVLRHGPAKSVELSGWRWAVQSSAVIFILIQAGAFTLTHFYRDDILPMQDSRVEEGPFAGIRTSHQRRNFISEFTAIVGKLEPGKTIFIYDMFAAGYLLAPLRPNGPTYMSILPQWMPQMRAPLVQYFQEPNHWPDYVVEFFKFPFGVDSVRIVNPRGQDPVGDPFKEFFFRTGRYQSIYDSDTYRILRKM